MNKQTKVNFSILDRRTGKTEFLVNKCSEGFYNKSLFVTINQNMVNEIKRKLNKRGILSHSKINVVSQFQFDNYSRGHSYQNLYLDEYLFFDKKIQTSLYKHRIFFENIHIASSLIDKIDRDMLLWVIFSKTYPGMSDYIIDKIDDNKNFEYLYNNFLTDIHKNTNFNVGWFELMKGVDTEFFCDMFYKLMEMR